MIIYLWCKHNVSWLQLAETTAWFYSSREVVAQLLDIQKADVTKLLSAPWRLAA